MYNTFFGVFTAVWKRHVYNLRCIAGSGAVFLLPFHSVYEKHVQISSDEYICLNCSHVSLTLSHINEIANDYRVRVQQYAINSQAHSYLHHNLQRMCVRVRPVRHKQFN